MEVWTATGPQNPSPFDLELPQFSLSPGEYMTRIGEHLLSLPQQLDLYADDASLAYSLGSLPGMEGQSVPSSSGVQGMDKKETEGVDGETDDEIDITYLWMTAVCHETLSTFVSSALSIPALSLYGTRQLIADMNYLVNVLSAMEIQASREFLGLLACLSLEPESLGQEVDGQDAVGQEKDEAALLAMEYPEILFRVRAMRQALLAD